MKRKPIGPAIESGLCLIVLLTFVLAGLIGCVGRADKQLATKLIGTWLSDPRQTEWGLLSTELTFREDGSAIAVVLAPGGGGPPVGAKQAKYKVRKGCLISDLFEVSHPMTIRLEGDDLIIDFGSPSPMRLKRR